MIHAGLLLSLLAFAGISLAPPFAVIVAALAILGVGRTGAARQRRWSPLSVVGPEEQGAVAGMLGADRCARQRLALLDASLLLLDAQVTRSS